MENGTGATREKDAVLPYAQSAGEHGRKDSQMDDVFDEVFSTPDSAYVLAHQQQLQAFGLGVGGVERDEKLEIPRGAEENGICERFEEAVDSPDEDWSTGQLKTDAADVSDAVDVGEEDTGGAAVVEIESTSLGIRGDGDGAEIGEMDDSIGVRENSENGGSGGMPADKAGVERGMVNDDNLAADVGLVTELNESESNIISGTGERDRNAILGGLLDHKKEKDESRDGVILFEKSANRDSDEVCFDNAVPVALGKGEDGDNDEVGTNKMPAVVLEKSQNGEFGNEGMSEAISVALNKSENGDFNGVHGEKAINDNLDQDGSLKTEGASVDAPINEQKILYQDESRETADASAAALGSSVSEGKIPLGHGTQKTEDGSLFNEGKIPYEDESQEMKDIMCVSESSNLEKITYDDNSLQMADGSSVTGSSTGEEKKPCQYGSQCREVAVADVANSDNDVTAKTENPPHVVSPETSERLKAQKSNSEVLLSSIVHEIVSDSSEVVSGNNELQSVEEPQKENKEEKPNFVKESAVGEFLERESVSVEEYGELSSAEEDDSDLIVQSAQALHSSAVNHIEVPPPRPAGLGSSAPLLEPAPRAPQQPRVNGNTRQRQSQLVEEPANGEAEEYDETREKLQMIRVKFLRLAHRLGQTPHNVVVAQVLYRLGLAEQLRGSRNTSRAGAFSFDRASDMAVQLEAAGQEALDFSCTIMVLGKTGVGKSATINSIFDEVKFSTDAFKVGTTKVQDIVGTVQGIRVRVIDTPGLHSSCMDQRRNEKILHSVKRFIKKTPPDIVLYLDRLDMQSRDFGDVPLLRTITDIFGPSIWFNAIVVLTHAASAPPDGPNGSPLSYEMFVTQRSHVVQQAIRQAAGDVRLMNPVSLVENHSACRTNRAGQRVLPNGQVWKPQLLLLSFASKILAEANTLLKLQDSPPGKPFTARARSPPLPFLLSSLLQSRPQLKLPEEQFGDEDAMDEDLDDTSDSDDGSEYDELPPFKCLTKAQLSELSKAQKKAYYDELEYREKLFMRKQLKEEKMRRKLLKKMAAAAKDLPNDYSENPEEEETGGAASVPVPVPDMPLPASFDSDNPTHRYRYLDNSNQWLIRPVLDNHGWDHDVGYEGLNVERLFVVKDNIPVSFSGQVTKDKKECNFQMELASSIKHGEGKATSLGFDAQTVGKDTAYTLRAETRFMNFIRNKMAAGLSYTMLGDAITAGLKLEDKLMLHRRLRLLMSGGAMTSRGDVAYGGSLEATLRDKDHPIGQILSTLGVSVMDWHGDLAIGCNVQSQFPVGRTTNLIARANLNNRGSGQVSLRLNSSEQLQIALIAAVPVFRNIIKNRFFASSQPM